MKDGYEGPYATGHHLPQQYGEKLLIVERGNGCTIEDASGRTYLDFAGGIAVNALGYGRDDLSRVMAEQASKLIHISNLFTTRPTLELADKLCASGPGFDAVHFGNSGTEANEAALKYARAYWYRQGKPRKGMLAFSGSFHGRSMGALSLTSTEKYRKPFGPLVPGASFGRYNDLSDLRRRLSGRKGKRFAAVIVEAVQGEGGLEVMNPDFAGELNRLCKAAGIVLIADEVQTGLCRTGNLYASLAAGLEPDIITLAKPLAGGLPLSATLVNSRVSQAIHPGDHASTFGGGPVTCAVANALFDQLNQPEFLEQVNMSASYLEERLKALQADFPTVFAPGELKGRGLLRGIALQNPDITSEVVSKCMEEGLLILRAGTNVLRLAPPLIIEKSHIDEMESKLKKVLGRIQ